MAKTCIIDSSVAAAVLYCVVPCVRVMVSTNARQGLMPTVRRRCTAQRAYHTHVAMCTSEHHARM